MPKDTHNYLKYWRIIRYWVKAKYNLTTPDIEMILFLYSEDYFAANPVTGLLFFCTVKTILIKQSLKNLKN